MEVLEEDHEIEYIHISDAAVLTFGEMQINPGQRQVFQNGTGISLTTRELTVRQIYKAVTGEEGVIGLLIAFGSFVIALLAFLDRDKNQKRKK